MAILEMVIQSAQLIGSPLAGLIFSKWKSHPINFGISAAVCISAWIYLTFFVQETTPIENRKWKKLFDFNHPKEVWRTCFRPRANHRRPVILLCAFVLGTFISILDGEAQIGFLFVRLQFGWTLEWFNTVSAILLSVIVIGKF